MTFLGLAQKNTWRKPLRTLLLILCVAVAFIIYGLTASFIAGSQGANGASDNILGVMSAAGRSQPLPLSALTRIADDLDVEGVAYTARFRAFSVTERNQIAVSAADPALLANVTGKALGLTLTLLSELGAARDNVLVGRALAEAQGWTVGQTISLTAFDMANKNNSRDWRFRIAGIFNGENPSTDTYFIIARYDYVNAARLKNTDTVDAFLVLPSKGASTNELAARIDQKFANSATPTRTQSEKQFLEAFLRQFADMATIVNMVVGVAFVTLLMIVVNSMVFAVRERTFEIAVLKVLGVSRTVLFTITLAETCLIFFIGGVLGVVVVKLATLYADPVLGLTLTTPIIAEAACITIVLAVATGLLPALRAIQTPILKAFRTR